MKYFAMLLFLAASFSLSAQSEKATLKSAAALVAEKKYDSAYKALDKFDPDNKHIDIVLMKQDILLKYFVTSMAHQMFALKDLEAHEDVMDYRGEEGTYSMHMFAANEILDTLIAANPDNCKLYKAGGDFYYDVYLRYGGQWLKSDEEVFSSVKADYAKAIEGKCADYMSYYVLGYLELLNENYTASMPHFLKSIELDKEYPTSHYNLAYAYLYTDDRKNALMYAENALELYKEPGYKADAARMMGQIYLELEDSQNAIANYELAETIEPGNYYSLKPLLALYVQTNNAGTNTLLGRFFDLAPGNATIYSDLEGMYLGSGKERELAVFYNGKLKEIKSGTVVASLYDGEMHEVRSDQVLGNINFFLASLYITSDKKLARTHFLAAKESFTKVFKPDHEVFGIIEEGLKNSEG